MAASSQYHDELSPPTTKHAFSTEMYNLPSPDPSYNRAFQSPQQPLDPHGHAPSSAVPPTPDPEDGKFSRLATKKLEKLKRWLQMIRVGAQGVSTILSVIMFGIMIYVNVKFYTTKGTIRDGRNPWPLAGTKLWPAIMLLVASGTTLVLSLVVLFNYCCNRRRAQASWKLTVVRYVIHILAWIVVSVIYRYEKSLHGNNNDLWGWSCSSKANQIQAAFNGVVDFKLLCSIQVSSRCSFLYTEILIIGSRARGMFR